MDEPESVERFFVAAVVGDDIDTLRDVESAAQAYLYAVGAVASGETRQLFVFRQKGGAMRVEFEINPEEPGFASDVRRARKLVLPPDPTVQ